MFMENQAGVKFLENWLEIQIVIVNRM